MAKIAKKKLQEPHQDPTFEPDPPKVQPETAPPPPDEPEDPEITEEDDEPSQPDDETEVSTPEPEPPPTRQQANGPKPRKFGDPDRTVLDRLNALDSWEGVWAYVYRIQPFSNRLVGGNRKVHVKRYDTPFDVQVLMDEAGSGVYQIQATRLAPATGKRAMFDSGEIRILNQNHPPKIPPGEWVDDPRNKEWQWAKDAIFKKEPPAPVAPPQDPIVEILRDQIRGQNEQMAELRKEMREAATRKDPGEQTLVSILAPFVPAIVQHLTRPAPVPPPPPPAPDPIAQLTAAITLIKQIENKPEPAKDAAAELDAVLKIQDKMDERYGSRNNGSRSRKTGWQEVISEVAGPLAEVLKPITGALAMGVMQQQRAAAQQQQPGQQQPGQQQPNQPPAYTELPAPTEEQPHRPGPQLVKKPTLEAVATAVLDALKAKETGLDLGDWYIEKYGMEEYSEIRNQGKARLLDDLRSLPNIWKFIAAYFETGDLDLMLTEFLTWEPPEDHEQPDEPERTAAPQVDAIKSGWNATAPQEARP